MEKKRGITKGVYVFILIVIGLIVTFYSFFEYLFMSPIVSLGWLVIYPVSGLVISSALTNMKKDKELRLYSYYKRIRIISLVLFVLFLILIIKFGQYLNIGLYENYLIPIFIGIALSLGSAITSMIIAIKTINKGNDDNTIPIYNEPQTITSMSYKEHVIYDNKQKEMPGIFYASHLFEDNDLNTTSYVAPTTYGVNYVKNNIEESGPSFIFDFYRFPELKDIYITFKNLNSIKHKTYENEIEHKAAIEESNKQLDILAKAIYDSFNPIKPTLIVKKTGDEVTWDSVIDKPYEELSQIQKLILVRLIDKLYKYILPDEYYVNNV